VAGEIGFPGKQRKVFPAEIKRHFWIGGQGRQKKGLNTLGAAIITVFP